jgi:hypothetical protein
VTWGTRPSFALSCGAKIAPKGEDPLADEKHPYASPGAVTAAVNQFRKTFPATVTADTLRKLGIAPQNESYVINTLRYIGVIDEEGNKTTKATAVFNHHDNAAFQKAFGDLVKDAYKELFELHSDAAWDLSFDSLIGFFRNADQTSDVVGRRQASTFQALAGLAGHGEAPAAAKPRATKEPKPKNNKPPKQTTAASTQPLAATLSTVNNPQQRDFGLTVRIEVNLPPAADQETYDRIFRSIRENLLNAK